MNTLSTKHATPSYPRIRLIAGKLGAHIAQPGVSSVIEALNGVSANLRILEGHLPAAGLIES